MNFRTMAAIVFAILIFSTFLEFEQNVNYTGVDIISQNIKKDLFQTMGSNLAEGSISLNIAFIGETSVATDRISQSGTIRNIPFYNYVSTNDISLLVFKVNFFGHTFAYDVVKGTGLRTDRNDYTVTGQIFALSGSKAVQITYSDGLGDNGIPISFPQGDTPVSILYLLTDNLGNMQFAYDTVIIRIRRHLREFPESFSIEDFTVEFNLTDEANSIEYITFNNTVFSNRKPTGNLQIERGTRNKVNVSQNYILYTDSTRASDWGELMFTASINTVGSVKTIDDYLVNGKRIADSESIQDAEGQYYNVIDGDPAFPGIVFMFDDFGIKPITNSRHSLSLFTNSNTSEIGILYFNPLGLVTKGWGTHSNIDLGGNYSANFGFEVNSISIVHKAGYDTTSGIPYNLTSMVENEKVRLNWKYIKNFRFEDSQFRIFRSIDGSEFIKIGDTVELVYLDDLAKIQTNGVLELYYKVKIEFTDGIQISNIIKIQMTIVAKILIYIIAILLVNFCMVLLLFQNKIGNLIRRKFI